jgi:hypothetical protein
MTNQDLEKSAPHNHLSGTFSNEDVFAITDSESGAEIPVPSNEISPSVIQGSIDISLIERTGIDAEVIAIDFEREKFSKSIVYVHFKPEYQPAVDGVKSWFKDKFGFDTKTEQVWIKAYSEIDDELKMHREWGRLSPGEYSVIVTMGGEGKFLYEDSQGSEEQIDCIPGTVVVLDGSMNPMHGSRDNIGRSFLAMVLSKETDTSTH